MKKFVILLAIFCGLGVFTEVNAKGKIENYDLKSPNGKIEVSISFGDEGGDIYYKVKHENTLIIDWSPISMELGNGTVLGKNCQTKNVNKNSVNEIIDANFYKKAKVK